MAKIIPNEKSWVGFTTASLTGVGPTLAITAAQVAACTQITGALISINASATGNTVPTPTLDTLFESSLAGTVSASFSMDLYYDDASNVIWDLFDRGDAGYVVISRFGGTGGVPIPHYPISTQKCEVWPITVTARTPGPLTSNTAQTYTVTCAVTKEPNEWCTVSA